MTGGTVRGRTLRVVLSAATLTAVLVGLAAMWTLRRELEAAAREVNQARAARLASHVRGAVERGTASLEAVATTLAARSLDPPRMAPVLDLSLHIQPTFRSIYAYDAEGKVLLRRYRASEAPAGPGTPERSATLAEKDDAEFQASAAAVLADGESRTLALRRHRGGDLFLPCLVAVIGANGKPRGLLSGAVSAGGEGFDTMLAGLAPGAGGWVALTDADGAVLAASPHAPRQRGQLAPPSSEVRATATMDDLGLRAVVALPTAEAYAALPGALGNLVLAALAALLIGGAAGVVLALRVTAPLGELVQGIRRVEEGVLGHRVQVDGEDEVAEVSRAFNRLAETLARHEMLGAIWAEVSDDEAPAPPEGEPPPAAEHEVGDTPEDEPGG